MSDEILGMDYLEAVEQSNITVFDKRNSLPADQLDADDLLGLYGELLDDYKGAMRRLRSIESEITRIRAELEAARAQPPVDGVVLLREARDFIAAASSIRAHPLRDTHTNDVPVLMAQFAASCLRTHGRRARAQPQGAALLTEAQVRAVMRPLVADWRHTNQQKLAAAHAIARRLLARGPDEQSGLEAQNDG